MAPCYVRGPRVWRDSRGQRRGSVRGGGGDYTEGNVSTESSLNHFPARFVIRSDGKSILKSRPPKKKNPRPPLLLSCIPTHMNHCDSVLPKGISCPAAPCHFSAGSEARSSLRFDLGPRGASRARSLRSAAGVLTCFLTPTRTSTVLTARFLCNHALE